MQWIRSGSRDFLGVLCYNCTRLNGCVFFMRTLFGLWLDLVGRMDSSSNTKQLCSRFESCSNVHHVEFGRRCHFPSLLSGTPAMAMGLGCDPTRLAVEIAHNCDAGASSSCCEVVVTSVDTSVFINEKVIITTPWARPC
jgi:hypothetical protein